MISNLTLAKKLASYSLLASAFIAQKSDAQIIHHTLTKPDTLPVNGNLYYLDLNQDEISDFTINGSLFVETGLDEYGYPEGYRTFKASIRGSHDNEQVALYNSPSNPYRSAAVIPAGQQIGSAYNWHQSALLKRDFFYYDFLYQLSYYAGQWLNQVNKFAGLRIQDTAKGNNYYGWVRLTLLDQLGSSRIFDPAFVIITDYAFQTSPNTPIVAGDTGGVTGIKPVVSSDLRLFTDRKILSVRVSNPDYLGGNIFIYDESGKMILSQKIGQERFEMNLQMFPAGIYFVELKNEAKHESDKIILQ